MEYAEEIDNAMILRELRGIREHLERIAGDLDDV
jgi:hypothetical protein